MKFSQIPADAFRRMVLNAAVIASAFDPDSGTLRNEDILGATTGGIAFSAVPVYADMGDKVDNCPKNMKELKKLVSWEAKVSGTFVTADTALAGRVAAAADVSGHRVTPRFDLADGDFHDIWIVGDYSEYNGEQKKYIANYIAQIDKIITSGADLDALSQYVDIDNLVDWLILQEYTYNMLLELHDLIQHS